MGEGILISRSGRVVVLNFESLLCERIKLYCFKLFCIALQETGKLLSWLCTTE